jgi:hypothetical protein
MWALGGAVTANGSPARPARPAPAAQLDDGLTWTPASVRAHDPTIRRARRRRAAAARGAAPGEPHRRGGHVARRRRRGAAVHHRASGAGHAACARHHHDAAGHLAVEATLVERADDRLLLVPPGAGGWWLVDATTPAEVTLETLTRRPGPAGLGAVPRRGQRVDRRRGRGAAPRRRPPPPPPSPSTELLRRLTADAALADAVAALRVDGATRATLTRTATAIRSASARAGDPRRAARPCRPTSTARRSTSRCATPSWRRRRSSRSRGPAVLAIDATGVAGADLELSVRSHGAVIASTFRAGTSAAPPEASRREASLRVPIGYGKVRVSISALGASTLTVVRRTARARVRTWRQERRIGPDLRNACAAAIALPSADDADDAVGLVRARARTRMRGLARRCATPAPGRGRGRRR